MLIDIDEDISVDPKQIQGIFYSRPIDSDSDFKYHPEGTIILKSGDKIKTTKDIVELRSMLRNALEGSESVSDSEIRLPDDVINSLKVICEELQSIQEFHKRFVFRLEDHFDLLERGK